MFDSLRIDIYPGDNFHGEPMNRLIQDTMAEEGVIGGVSVCFVMPEALELIGISRLPGVVIDDQVVLQGRLPTRVDVVGWFDRLVPKDERAPRRDPNRTGWPSSLDEAVTWLIDGMREKDKYAVASADDDDLLLANTHRGWGQGIRNGYGLWVGNQALLSDCGTDNADEASHVIIRAVRDRLRRARTK